MSSIDFEALWPAVLEVPPPFSAHSIHGPDHWRRVERNACILAQESGAQITVIRLFALFHDVRRVNDCRDPDHGRRGAEFARQVRGRLFQCTDDEFALLEYACIWHTDAHRHDDPTIGTCWDADRLDLGRAGIVPSPAFMSTRLGAQIAEHGDITPWLPLAEAVLPARVSGA